MRFRFEQLATFFVSIVVLVMGSSWSSNKIQPTADDWSEPVFLFESDGWSQFSDIVVSADGTIHVFWQSDPSKSGEGVQSKPGADDLWYSQISGDEVTEPVNILVPPSNGSIQSSIRVAADREDQLHVFLWSVPECLQQSIVKLPFALSPQTWMEQTDCIGETRVRFGITADLQGGIHLVYGAGSGRIIHSLYSPATDQWSPLRTVFAGDDDIASADTRVAVDDTGRIHVVWSRYEGPTWYPPSGVFYAQSDDGGNTWSTPRQLAGKGHVEPEIVAVGNDQIHAVWNGAITVNNRYHRASNDGGSTWSERYDFEIAGGILGPPALAVDSANTVHAILSSDHGLFYASWTENGGWSEIEDIWTDTQTGDPSAVITEGNKLHLLFREGVHKIIYMYRDLDAPRLAGPGPGKDVEEEPAVNEALEQSFQPPPGKEDLIPLGETSVLSRTSDGPASNSVFIGLVPALALIAGIIGWKISGRR